MKNDPNCSLCGLCKTTDDVCILGKGPKHTKAMIISEAPGRPDYILEQILEDIGIDEKDVYITHTVHCRPPENRTPRKGEINKCSKWLQYELQHVKPSFVLLLGNVPLLAITGKSGIKKIRGRPFLLNKIYYFPTYHPSFAIRDPRNEPTIRSDIRSFFQMVKSKGLPHERDTNIRLISNKTGIELMLDDLRSNTFISGDIETSGLNAWAIDADVATIQFGTKDCQWVLPVNNIESPFKGQEKLIKQTLREIKVILKGKILIGQNWKFDCIYLKVKYDIWIHCQFDTMVAHHILDENDFHGLKYLATKFFGAPNYDIDKKGDEMMTEPLVKIAKYGGHDIFYTRKLYFALKKLLKEDYAVNRLFWKVVMPCVPYITEMEYDGVYINPQRLDDAYDYWTEVVADKQKQLDRWSKKYGHGGMNFGSPKQLSDFLFTGGNHGLGLEPIKETKTGKYSTDESVLKQLSVKHDVPKLIIDFRKASKQLSTFIVSWQEKQVKNYLHPNWKMIGTVTGRLACAEPNIQATPRDKRVRSLITAPKGWTLVEADYSQIELRIIAHVANEQTMKFIFQTGGDIHVKTCNDIFGISEPDYETRKRAKAINFGYCFGMWVDKFLIYCKDKFDVTFTYNEGRKIRKDFFTTYSGLSDWHNRQRRFVRRNGYVRSLFGRKRRLPAASQNDESYECKEAQRQAINAPIQAVPPDLCYMSMIELREAFNQEWFKICAQVHDALLFRIRNDKIDYCLPIIKSVMEHPKLLDELGVEFSVPIEIEIKVGPWNDSVVWKESDTGGKRRKKLIRNNSRSRSRSSLAP